MNEFSKKVIVVAEEEEPVDELGHGDLDFLFFGSFYVVQLNEHRYVEELNHQNSVELTSWEDKNKAQNHCNGCPCSLVEVWVDPWTRLRRNVSLINWSLRFFFGFVFKLCRSDFWCFCHRIIITISKHLPIIIWTQNYQILQKHKSKLNRSDNSPI